MLGGMNNGLTKMANAKIARINRKKDVRKKLHDQLIDRGDRYDHYDRELSEEERLQLRNEIDQTKATYAKEEKRAIQLVALFFSVAIVTCLLFYFLS